jgi:hypothetical protein
MFQRWWHKLFGHNWNEIAVRVNGGGPNGLDLTTLIRRCGCGACQTAQVIGDVLAVARTVDTSPVQSEELNALRRMAGLPLIATPANRWEGLVPPKGSSPFFGWIDLAGEPASVRVEFIAAVAKDARSGRFMIVMANAGVAPSISDGDAYQLLRRLGWSLEPAPVQLAATTKGTLNVAQK